MNSLQPVPPFAGFAIPLRALVLALLVASLGGCGGGGGSTPTPPTDSLGPAAGSVTSSDGKVTVAVGDNALQAPVAISIAPATADAATAADPSYVPGTTYTFTAPDIQVPEQVMITIESPLAVAATTSATGREHSLALPPGYFPPPTCLVNSPSVLAGTAALQNIYVSGAECPAAPAPGCVKVLTTPNSAFSLCAPAVDVILVPAVQATCPDFYREVTGEEAFAVLSSQYGNSRVCQRIDVYAPPVLSQGSGRSPIACSVKTGKFLCPAPKLPSGTFSVLWDKTPPPKPVFLRQLPLGAVVLTEDGPAGTLNFRITASDPDGLGGIEVVEVTGAGSYADGVTYQLPTRQVWRAEPALFEGAALKSYDSGIFSIPYTLADPSHRYFFARVYDRAGNSRKSDARSADGLASVITIGSFTVSPASVAPPGGNVTLSWNVKGAAAASIDQGVGAIAVTDSLTTASTGSIVVNVSGSKTFTLTATHPSRTTRTATASVTLGADAVAPAVSLAASPLAVVAPGSTTLTATASDAVGVTKVEFFRGATLIGTDATAPYTQTVNFTPADVGSVAFTAKAFDAANNSTTSAVVNVAVNADTAPPTVALLANPATVLVPGPTTLQATASDNIGVTKVEFFRGATLIATDNAAPFQTTVNLTNADLGTVAFTAKAFDAQNNSTTGAVVNVLATTPSAGDTYASPTGTDAGNTTCAQANPCRSIALAAATAQANKTVWLTNGEYTATTQPAPIAFPAGLTLRALTPGLASVGQGIVLQGNATVVGVVLRRNGIGDWGSIAASAGAVTLDGVKAAGTSTTGSGFPAVLALSGTVHATMTPGNIADYTDELPLAGQGTATYATLAGSARLTVNGGVFGGARLGGADSLSGAFNRGAFNLAGSSRLDLNNVVLNVESGGIFVYGDATQINLTGTTLNAAANVGPGYGIHAAKGTPQVTIVSSAITGFDNSYTRASAGILVGTFGQPGVALTLSTTGTGILANNAGVFVNDYGSSPSSLVWTGTATEVANNTHGGVVCRDACNIDLAGGEITQNATNDPAANSNAFYGGVWMGLATKTFQLKLRGMTIVDNKSTAGSNANSSSNSGVTMAGDAASVFDLGTAASPGNNVIQGNTSSAQTSGLNVNVAAGVTVNAVGNTFAPNVQGANAQGKYQLGTAPCGPASCTLTVGTGANYRVGSGTLRLAQ
jgi:Bacterial Ig domain